MKKICFIFIFISFAIVSLAQLTATIEMLEKKVKTAPDDTNKVKDLLQISNLVSANNYKKALATANEGLEISYKLKYFRGIGNSYSNLADAYWYHADFDSAQHYYFKSYKLYDSIHDIRGKAMAQYNIGWITVIQQKKWDQAHYFYEALDAMKKLKDTSGLMQMHNAMGSYFMNRFKEEGKLTRDRPFFDSSLKYFKEGILYGKRGEQRHNVGRLYSNMSDLYGDIKDYKTALEYSDQSAKILLELNDTASYMICNMMRSKFLQETGRTKEAKANYETILAYSSSHDMPQIKAAAIRGLSNSYYDLGEYKIAFQRLSDFIDIQDKINRETYSSSLNDLQSKYDLEKSEAKVKELNHKTEIEHLHNTQNLYFIFILLAVAVIVIVVAVLLFRQNKLKQSVNLKLQEQNTIITEKKQEIDKSIQYAKGIQNAVLPDVSELKKQFAQSFVFYSPKDVVSGDFYWLHDTDNYFYAIAADCTGHGVPGALMSIVSMDKLSQAIFEKKLHEPAHILQFLNVEIKRALKQHSEESKQKDGLDIALLRFDKKKDSVVFAGANRPLYLVRDQKLSEFKADKVAIAGFTPDDFKFNQQEIRLQKNDCLYLSSDGYADQFGGQDAKKFMTRNFKSLLERIHTAPMSAQEKEIIDSHQQWKGNYEQVDDILVIGIKI